MLKYMEIRVRKYDERALILNGWVRVGRKGVKIFELNDVKNGISNFILETEEQLNRVMTLNNELKCYSLDFNLINSVEAESIEYPIVDQKNYDIYTNCCFNKVKHLEFNNLSSDQVKSILTRFKKISRVKISFSSLNSIYFSQFRINQFSFLYISFKEPVYLPKEIDKLELRDCEFPNLIEGFRVDAIDFYSEDGDPKEYKELVKTLRGIKAVKIDIKLEEYLTFLPSTVRKINIRRCWDEINNLEEIADCFPNLIEINRPVPIKAINKTKLRVIEPIMSCNEEKFTVRTRKIMVTSDNAVELNNHQELFEKVEYIVIRSYKLNLDILSAKTKKINIWKEVDDKSYDLK